MPALYKKGNIGPVLSLSQSNSYLHYFGFMRINVVIIVMIRCKNLWKKAIVLLNVIMEQEA